MYYIGLDLSTQSGIAIFHGDKLVHSQTIETDRKDFLHLDYPYNYIERAGIIVTKLLMPLSTSIPTTLIIEETNQMARDRYAQKQLEFIHCILHQALDDWFVKPNRIYLSTSKWKSLLGIKLTKEQKTHNKLVKDKKARGKITNKHLTVDKINEVYKLDLKMKDNNEADAIALVSAYLIQQGFTL